MKLTRLSPADYKTTPWKNGKGVTTEIAIFPEGATLEDFVWRVSSAVVSEAGDFSKFPGYTRDLAVIEGEGLILANGTGEKVLDRFEVYRFEGDDSIGCRLRGGTVRDLNLIFRKDRVRARMEVLRSSRTLTLSEGTSLIFCVVGTVRFATLAEGTLGPREAVLVDVDKPSKAELRLDDSVCFIIQVQAI